MNPTQDKMLAEHDPSQTLLQQVVGVFLTVIAALGTWIARLKVSLKQEENRKGITERRCREIIREELRSELDWRFGKP